MKTLIWLICIGTLLCSWHPASLIVAFLALLLLDREDK